MYEVLLSKQVQKFLDSLSDVFLFSPQKKFHFTLFFMFPLFCHSCGTSLRVDAGISLLILCNYFSLLTTKIDSGICSKTRKTGMTILIA